MYLLDTNILLELLLQREHASVVIQILQAPDINCSISDFSFHSIGLFLFKKIKRIMSPPFNHLYGRLLNDFMNYGSLLKEQCIHRRDPDHKPNLNLSEQDS